MLVKDVKKNGRPKNSVNRSADYSDSIGSPEDPDSSVEISVVTSHPGELFDFLPWQVRPLSAYALSERIEYELRHAGDDPYCPVAPEVAQNHVKVLLDRGGSQEYNESYEDDSDFEDDLGGDGSDFALRQCSELPEC